MRLEDLDFAFPEELIAQHPAEPRDSCRLMHLRGDGSHVHQRFDGLPLCLLAGDTLVFNDSKVLPARMRAHKASGGRVELLFLHPSKRCFSRAVGGPTAQVASLPSGEVWEVLARPSHRLKPGMSLSLEGGEAVLLTESLGEGRWEVQAPPQVSLVALMEEHGALPLPPYIRENPDDPDSYQTVYANTLGSAAAPTAGLHFTPGLLETLAKSGVGSAFVTLHVGLDTFQPIREEQVESHRIHRETYAVTASNLEVIRAARSRGGRLVAVGTTATRVLETIAKAGLIGERGDASGSHIAEDIFGETQIFITPGYRFLAVDALLTNFHLPRSSVLALTMAFAGPERLRAAYGEAIALRYRFFSFGDAMLIDEPVGPLHEPGGGR